MAKTPNAPPEAKKPEPTQRSAAANKPKIVVSKQVFTDFAAI